MLEMLDVDFIDLSMWKESRSLTNTGVYFYEDSLFNWSEYIVVYKTTIPS